MNPRFSDDELRGLRHDMDGLDPLGEFTMRNCVMLSMVTELLALRAEVERLRSVAALVSILKKDTGALLADNERLRAVEQAARALQAAGYSCGNEALDKALDLRAALDATKQEPGT